MAKALTRFGYIIDRQTGSHIRLTTQRGEHHITIPAHDPIKIGTLWAYPEKVDILEESIT